MNKVKVAHVLHSVGGVDIYLRLLTENVDPNQVSHLIIHEKNDNEPYFDALGEQIQEFHIPVQREINFIKDISAILKTRKILKKEKPDVVHAHSAKGGIIARSAALYLNVVVLHTPHAYSFLSAENSLKKKLFLGLERFFKYFNSKLLATSVSEWQQGIRKVKYTPANAMFFLNSIRPIENISPLGIEKTWPDDYICSIGRPSYQKDIEMMVEVLKELRKERLGIHLVLMGVGFHSPNLKGIKRLIEKYELQRNITLLEWTGRKDIFHIIKKAQLYISTARYEGLPYSIIEAMALKKTCVVTDADGNRDLIKNGENGFVVFDRQPMVFKSKVLELLENPDLRRSFEKNAFEKFNAHFNIENSIHILENIYLENSLKNGGRSE